MSDYTQTTSVDAGPSAFGITLAQAAGFFHLFIGTMIVISIMLFLGGFGKYYSHLGQINRDEGFHYMTDGINLLFIVIVLIALLKYIQYNPGAVIAVVAIGIIILSGGFIIQAIQSMKSEEADH